MWCRAQDNDEAKATPAEPTAEPAQEVSNNACASPERVTDAASSPAPPAMPSPEKVEAARVEAEEELREEHELQAEEVWPGPLTARGGGEEGLEVDL